MHIINYTLTLSLAYLLTYLQRPTHLLTFQQSDNMDSQFQPTRKSAMEKIRCNIAILLCALGVFSPEAVLYEFAELIESIEVMDILGSLTISEVRGFGVVISSRSWKDIKVVITVPFFKCINSVKFQIRIFRDGMPYNLRGTDNTQDSIMTTKEVVGQLKELMEVLAFTSDDEVEKNERQRTPIDDNMLVMCAMGMQLMGVKRVYSELGYLHELLSIMKFANDDYEIDDMSGFGIVLSSERWSGVKIVITMAYFSKWAKRMKKADNDLFVISMIRDGREHEREDIPEIDDTLCIMTRDEIEEQVKKMNMILATPSPTPMCVV